MNQTCACEHEICEQTTLERPRYFPRQLITDAELTQEQLYFRDRLRRHNRLLHGWGVVCGALVCPYVKDSKSGTPEPWKVVLRSGYILGPYGDEILIEGDRVFDLRTKCSSVASDETCAEVSDPWCSDVYVKPEQPGVLYVAVRYKESQTRPVRVQPAGCGCDDARCENSRWRDGYEVCALPYCPDDQSASGKGNGTPPAPDGGALQQDALLLLAGCPCPIEPWVVLAAVSVDTSGVIRAIDNCACRRVVASFANFAGHCRSGELEIERVTFTSAGATSETLPAGASATMTITGQGFAAGARVSLGAGVTVSDGVNMSGEGTQLTATVSAAAEAPPGERLLVITNPDCRIGVRTIVLGDGSTVEATSAPAGEGRSVTTRTPRERPPRRRR